MKALPRSVHPVVFFKDSKSRFGWPEFDCPKRLSRLLMALTMALTRLTLLVLAEIGALPMPWHAAVV